MKSIFAAQNAPLLRSVYPDDMRELLSDDPHVYTREDILRTGGLSEVEAIFSTWSMVQLTEEEIKSRLPSLRAVFYAAGTVQSFARPFLRCGVTVCSAWAANAVPVAEYTVANIILANKGFHMSARLCSRGARSRGEAEECMRTHRGNYGCEVGIIGAGMIGSLVCELLRRHELSVLVYDPFCSADKARGLGVTLVGLEELFSRCEVISCHLADNAQTRGMLDYGLFSLMRDGATFINTGRGAQVVESDLVRALLEKPHCCAVLDVTDPEPPAPDSALYSLPNVILTPHIAGSQRDEYHRMALYMQREYEAFEQNRPLRFCVSEEMLATMA